MTLISLRFKARSRSFTPQWLLAFSLQHTWTLPEDQELEQTAGGWENLALFYLLVIPTLHQSYLTAMPKLPHHFPTATPMLPHHYPNATPMLT